MSALKLLQAEIEISDKEFQIISDYAYKHSCIHFPLEPKNISLMTHRLRKVLRIHRINDISEMTEMISSNQLTESLKTDIINSLTTNKTEFFREDIHYKIILEEILSKSNKSSLNIWSAACSTGQEPVSLVMTFDEKLPASVSEKIRILATDIDTEVLKTATEAVYEEDQVANLSEFQKLKYFDNIHTIYALKDEYKNKIHYSQLNLFDYPYKISKKFDIILCRNVMIYFKPEDRKKLTENLIKYLEPGGCIIFGISEAASIEVQGAEYIGHSVFRRTS